MKYTLIAVSVNSVAVIREYDDIMKLAKETADCMAVNIRKLLVTQGDAVIFENYGLNNNLKWKEIEKQIETVKSPIRILTENERKTIKRIKYRVM